ncbi:MAG: hypothetical protein FWG20_03350, partial [Candidatus Cloacimonetes bacterium]|nr:hypothetical protein [Candidatus Cloacimonadota bacterium]
MQKIIVFLVSIIALLGCERKTNVVFENRTSHNLYYTLNETAYIVAGHETQKHSVKIGTQYFFYQPEKNIAVTAEGETFMTP